LDPDSIDDLSSLYSGVPSADDNDGDGIANASDNCPNIFNPIRPVDGDAQGDADSDATGDVCDPCPLDANTTDCTPFDPNDRDGDGFENARDVCPDDENPGQEDADGDGHGDVCDACPDDENPGTAGCPATLYEMKNGTIALDADRWHFADLIVTAVQSNGFYVQMDPESADYDGVELGCAFAFYPFTPKPAVGDRIEADAVPTDFFDQIELSFVTFTVNGTGPLPNLVTLPGTLTSLADVAGDNGASPYEGCLVEVVDVSVTSVAPTAGAGDNLTPRNEFEIDSNPAAGAPRLRVDDRIFLISPQPTVGETFGFIRGVLAFTNEHLRIFPRSGADVGFGDADVGALTPALSFKRTDTAAGDTFPEPLRVVLNRVSSEDTTVLLESTDATNVSVPASVVVPAGAPSAVIPVTAGAGAVTATITAKIDVGDVGVTAQVRTLAPDQPAAVFSITPTDSLATFDETIDFTVTLDVPAPVGGTTINLASTIGTVPATVDVAENESVAQFTLLTGAVAGVGTVTATLGGDVVADVEIVDPSNFSADLSGFRVVQTNSTNGAQKTFTLPANTIVPVGGYVVIGRDAARAAFETFWGPLGEDVVYVDGNDFQSLNDEGKTFELRQPNGTVIDGPTIPHVQAKSIQRVVPVLDAELDDAWVTGEDEPGAATPGAGQAAGGDRGCYVSEVSDASGTGNFIYEMVEIHCDGSVP
jgi:hypothetical protein